MLKIFANVGATDVEYEVDSEVWIEIDPATDSLLFSSGSDTVANEMPIPSEAQLNAAGVVLTGAEQTVSKYFLSDASAGILREIKTMGAGNNRYVLGFVFDAPTASEPILEVWDDVDLDTIDNVSLGAGVASNSFFRGITTTNALPGAGWTGNRLAGSSDGNFLWLNSQNGPLDAEGVLYCQLKIIIPASQLTSFSNANVIAIKYATV